MKNFLVAMKKDAVALWYHWSMLFTPALKAQSMWCRVDYTLGQGAMVR